MVQMSLRAMPTSKVENAGEFEAAQKQAMALEAVLENSEWLTRPKKSARAVGSVRATSIFFGSHMAFKNGMRPVHPGKVLREDYLRPLDLSVNALAKRLGISTSRLNDLVLERRGVTPDTGMRLARYFGGDARSWLNLQIAHDLRVAEIANTKEIERTVEPMRKSAWMAGGMAQQISFSPKPSVGVAEIINVRTLCNSSR